MAFWVWHIPTNLKPGTTLVGLGLGLQVNQRRYKRLIGLMSPFTILSKDMKLQ
ncbi:hypothetical protein SNOG_11513 [Parastagonospora nodorum SN15]|uniref:Uncharacterized protein n=1 Tax=Phaeosphaeria nodorum (strain SN15 / ATCC MYA-4574 / FGSC 10173) TaxID=321614 RepID=Q0U9Q1_PHANO|nr:hypothetical protein SNOG_11513 [Parastagonospora nodorum SN15]EAT81221.1 hypothetical protein SNOG_11513 [Parastagonospora nodorum SN15]